MAVNILGIVVDVEIGEETVSQRYCWIGLLCDMRRAGFDGSYANHAVVKTLITNLRDWFEVPVFAVTLTVWPML
jgi:hypothetical protein